jgi:hypothetical protein
MADEIQKALDDFDKARKRLNSAKGKGGAGAEAEYNQAYKRLVQLGVKPRLRGKYNV